ncbi:5'-methylthioadenosine/S-adenosylhomocysteine nucleosidase [Clostridium sp. MCC353]|uniref:5'-methylthioadenosine/S-adenosylhomocysteine nucleosidase n=1 Tax=Clostridium sp. MCC353 TaxID=2592646 RepID=UPI001C02ED5E|nr:5'-methylthioadenosine/S-adenosylhomocysteine nucleosidase [Clostridium sp. MCC353]MBT9776520.1 5'-methylthioadenosine/S-adenosylhomocysteine nucleosidase [Clostridium sp. MCC353]
MKKIGILCASDTELAPFLRYIHSPQITEKAMLKFYSGSIGQLEIVAVYSGVCKVNAAIAVQLLIDIFNVDGIINAGTAGGMDENVRLFDTVISERMVYHDVAEDILTEFHPWLKNNYFEAGREMLAAARRYSQQTAYPVLFGMMATGEQFIEDEKRNEINQKYAPLSVDMETAGAAHVCYVNHVPFLSVRTITDTAAHKGIENFERNCEIASERSAEIVIGILEILEI